MYTIVNSYLYLVRIIKLHKMGNYAFVDYRFPYSRKKFVGIITVNDKEVKFSIEKRDIKVLDLTNFPLTVHEIRNLLYIPTNIFYVLNSMGIEEGREVSLKVLPYTY